MKTSVICLRIAGTISVFFTLFHCLFNKLFNWDLTLSCLSQSDRAIMLTYHYICILMVGFMSILLLFQAKQILESKIGSSVLIFFSAFYLLRMITEFTLFGFAGIHSIFILILCLIPVILFIIPIIYNLKNIR